MASTGIKVRKSANDKVFDFFLYLLAAIIIIIVLYPMYFHCYCFYQQSGGCIGRKYCIAAQRNQFQRIYEARGIYAALGRI